MAAVVALKPRQYSFTSQAVANPAAPPPGDRLDSEIDRIDHAIASLAARLDALKLQQNSRSAPDNDANHALGMAAVAEDWALVSLEWAEHMPDTIPPSILASNAITGDHWSSRWWAHQALTIAQLLADGDLPPPLPPFSDVTGSVALPAGANGDIFIRNGTAAPITVTLPPSPVTGQFLRFKDCLGNAGTYPVTITGAAIDGNPSYVLRSDYMSLELFWMGSGAQWGTR